MSVNFEIKGMLARLLATEDLIVENKKVDTACFNVHTRVLTLPLWEKASNVVYDMLVAHEVSHALYTPDEDMTTLGVPHQFVNIVEDARVEKLVKRRYMGISKTFYGAYKELHREDFFSIENEDVSNMNIADRVNLYFKIGNFIEIGFNEIERKIVNEIENIETFKDTIVAAKNLYEYCKQEQEKKQSELSEINSESEEQNNLDHNSDSDKQTEMSDGQDSDEVNDQNQSQEFSSQKDSSIQSPQIGGSMSSIGEGEEPEVKTIDSLQKSIDNLINLNGYENHYLELPSLNMETVIVKNNILHYHIENYYKDQQRFYDEECEKCPNIINVTGGNIFQECDSNYEKFKNSAKKEVSYLVKEFECRKAADSYARATTARTGVLDCSKLHTYKFNEDLFRKVTTLSDGKNHGLIFILDWSGSMANVMLDTIKQLYNLIWFCKKVSIPFEVYAFSVDFIKISYDKNNKPVYPEPHYEKKSGLLNVDDRFNLLNFITSNVNSKTLEQQMINLWRVVSSFKSNSFTHPHSLGLSGTPLNESMIALHTLIPHFQKINKVQKVQCIILTDGESCPLSYHAEIKRNHDSEPYIGIRRVDPSTTFIRDRKLRSTYKVGFEYHEFTNALLRNLRDRFPDVNFIGMRILENRDVLNFIKRYCGYDFSEYEKVLSNWKKTKSFTITNSSYNGYLGMASSHMSAESEFEVLDDATKTQIKTAFLKSFKSKKMNKKILGEFVQLIA